MDKTKFTKKRLGEEQERDGYVPGTMAYRMNLAWELTREACALGRRYDAERRLQKHVTRVSRGGR